jgi:hypothetical protein
VANNGYEDTDSNFDEDDIDIVEWAKNKRMVYLPWVKGNSGNERSNFDTSKADKIFDWLL